MKPPTLQQIHKALHSSIKDLRAQLRAAYVNFTFCMVLGVFCTGYTIQANDWQVHNIMMLLAGLYLLFGGYSCSGMMQELKHKINATLSALGDGTEITKVDND